MDSNGTPKQVFLNSTFIVAGGKSLTQRSAIFVKLEPAEMQEYRLHKVGWECLRGPDRLHQTILVEDQVGKVVQLRPDQVKKLEPVVEDPPNLKIEWNPQW